MTNEQTFLMKPKVDFCFKELMEDAEIRKGFISALLDMKPEEIEKSELLPTHLRREHPEDKEGILDVRVFISKRVEEDSLKERNQGETSQVDLEIQLASFPLWPERSVFYLAKMYTGAIQMGQSYDVLQKCIHVGILDFFLFEGDEEFYSCFHLWEDTRHQMYTDKLEIRILELPKLAKREYPQTELLNWARFFNAEKEEEFEMAAEESSYIERAYERLVKLSADDLKRMEYEAREKAIRDHTYLMNYNLKKGREEGRKEGLEIGMKEGLEQGMKAFIEICQENALPRENVFDKLAEKFSLSSEEADKFMEKYWTAE